MFAIRHRGDGMWWVGQPGEPRFPPVAGSWATNAIFARRFLSEEDALYAAFLECPNAPSEYEAVVVPAVQVPSLVRRARA